MQSRVAEHRNAMYSLRTMPSHLPVAGRTSKPLRLDPAGALEQAQAYPPLRYMGSKHRLLPWIHATLGELEFDCALDAFSGSGAVSYLMKAMGKRVVANDFLNFSATLAAATVQNSTVRLSDDEVLELMEYDRRHKRFIQSTFENVFYDRADLRFLDIVSWNVRKLGDPRKRALALAALIRACVKKQPRGVFTVAGDLERYDDGRRDLRLSLYEHFQEQARAFNACVFSNGQRNRAICGDVFDVDPRRFDLVYMDPPYVPRADDNCYVKRYHFLEGLSCYWDGLAIMEETKVKKIEKRFTPFSYRRTAVEAFDRLFDRFRDSAMVLSYSSNGFPDLSVLVDLMKRRKRSVDVLERDHRYHFGTHGRAKRTTVREFLIVGT